MVRRAPENSRTPGRVPLAIGADAPQDSPELDRKPREVVHRCGFDLAGQTVALIDRCRSALPSLSGLLHPPPLPISAPRHAAEFGIEDGEIAVRVVSRSSGHPCCPRHTIEDDKGVSRRGSLAQRDWLNLRSEQSLSEEVTPRPIAPAYLVDLLKLQIAVQP